MGAWYLVVTIINCIWRYVNQGDTRWPNVPILSAPYHIVFLYLQMYMYMYREQNIARPTDLCVYVVLKPLYHRQYY